MTRLGLIGDTQGRYRVEGLLAAVRPHFAGVDEIWHAGDWQDERVLEWLRALGAPLTVVNGNAPDDPRYPERVVRRIEGLVVAMVHRPPRPDEPWVRDCRIVIHGHTHRWRDEMVGDVRFVNVGTATAAGFGRERTIGLLEVEGTHARLTRIDLGV
ncbi:MAG TPA: metallophosphoesterase family protein [Candidatus Dormibacteraeota bacterium]|nr:metallophosphoesterase family protein [Candidatus Dormibacteraeota bacterium]